VSAREKAIRKRLREIAGECPERAGVCYCEEKAKLRAALKRLVKR
jgi:hypothetical protein